jgi:hypothetical protein
MKRLLALTALATAVLAPQAAGAAVLSWDFSLDAWFENPAFAPIVGATGVGTPTAERYDLAWGTGGRQSALAIRDASGGFDDAGAAATGGVQTNGDFAAANRFFHDNRTIPLNSLALDDVLLHLDLDLRARNGTGTTSIAIEPLRVNFRETPNRGACASGVGQCADIFSLSAAVPFVDGAFTYGFEFDDQQYFVDLAAEGLGALTSRQCEAAGADDGCVGFITPERELNATQLALRIRSDVPEPATLGLLGLGLLGVAGWRRRPAVKQRG